MDFFKHIPGEFFDPLYHFDKTQQISDALDNNFDWSWGPAKQEQAELEANSYCTNPVHVLQ